MLPLIVGEIEDQRAAPPAEPAAAPGPSPEPEDAEIIPAAPVPDPTGDHAEKADK